MQFRPFPHVVLRFGLSLGLGLAVLLGSAGLVLATTLSLFVAHHSGAVVRAGWEASPETNPTSFNLSRKLPNEPNLTPSSPLASSGQRYYAYPDTCLAQRRVGWLPELAQYRFTLRGPGPAQAYLTAEPGPTGLVQRSWGTIKAMFR